MTTSQSSRARAWRIGSASSTRSAWTRYPDFCSRRTTSAASDSESSTCKTRSVSLIHEAILLPSARRTLSHRRIRLVKNQPVQAEIRDGGLKLLEIDRLSHVAVHPEIVSRAHVLLLFRGRQDHHRYPSQPRIRPDRAQDLQPRYLGQLEIQQNHRGSLGNGAAGVGAFAAQIIQRFLAVLRNHQLIGHVAPRKRSLGEIRVAWIVFHQQNRFIRFHQAAPRVKEKVAPRFTRASAHTRPPCRRTIR